MSGGDGTMRPLVEKVYGLHAEALEAAADLLELAARVSEGRVVPYDRATVALIGAVSTEASRLASLEELRHFVDGLALRPATASERGKLLRMISDLTETVVGILTAHHLLETGPRA